MRIDKYLAHMTGASRTAIKKLLHDGSVTINGQTIRQPSAAVNDKDTVTVNGEVISYVEHEYYLLNKPAGYLCTIDHSPNVLELVDAIRSNVKPVGRLDKDTEGLLLLTNDGQLSHRLISPRNHVPKTYLAITDREIPETAADTFSKPIQFSEFTSMPARLEMISANSALLTVTEGKYHQVNRMFHHIGCEVTYLKRISFGFLNLDGLETGQWRPLTENEIDRLKEL
ncbi:MAG: rRNA pseudouridine synthase [Erysipelotrichaceae bacterium]|nr:rRNA pseudouridine synthase [Erysipelotrichaceae bacterium]